MSKIHVDLFKGLNEDKKQRIVREFESSQFLLARLRQLAEEEIQKCYVKEEDLTGDPLELAKALGVRRGIRGQLKYLPSETKT